jgi:very-short-patch-repair endonuclease
MPDHDTLRILTARQHGVVGRRQLADLGFSRQAVAHAISSGRLERMSQRVLRLAGSPATPHQRAMAAALDVPGGAVGLHSATALFRVPGFQLEPVHVLTDRRPNRGAGHLGIVHSTVRWLDTDTTLVDGIPVTTPLRTLCDLAARIRPERLSLTCDRMLAGRLLRLEQLHGLGSVLPERGGAPGTRHLRWIIACRPPGYRPAESNLERRFESILAEADEAPFERQVDLGDADGWIGRVDFVDRERRVVVEVQSDLYHSGLVDRERDRRRITRLRHAGWTVVEVSEHEIWHRPDRVLAKVRAARSREATRPVRHVA